MSLFEKAIDHDLEVRAGKRKVGKVGQADGRSNSQEPSGGAIDLRKLGDRGLLSIFDDAAIFRTFRFLKRPVMARMFGPTINEAESGKRIMVTSPMPHAGKSFVAFNLAASIANEQMVNVVLMDADPLRHNLTTILGQDGRQGLLQMLADEAFVDCSVETSQPSLKFLPAGLESADSAELLASSRMFDVMASFDDPNTVVVLDTTPLLIASEAYALSFRTDHVFVVIEAGQSTVSEIEAGLQLLHDKLPSVSFVMNKLPDSRYRKGQEVLDFHY